MKRNKKIQFNVNELEYKWLMNAAKGRKISMAELLREFVKTLENS